MIQVIMGHGEAWPVIHRHLPVWERLELPLLLYFPAGDSVQTGHPTFTFGHREHHGAHAIERFRTLLLHLEGTAHDSFLIQEYDSFSLELPQITPGTVHGNLFRDDSPKWLGGQFLHPPLAFDRAALESLVAASGLIPDHAERGFWDRWIGLVCKSGNIPTAGWNERGFAHNTIEPQFIPSAVEARKNGATHFHGVKSEQCLAAILAA